MQETYQLFLIREQIKKNRIYYPECNRTPLCYGELTNILCLNPACKAQSLICIVCVDQYHAKHPIRAIKTVIDTVQKLPQQESLGNVDELLEIVKQNREKMQQEYDEFVRFQMKQCQIFKEKQENLVQRLQDQIIAKVQSSKIIKDTIESCYESIQERDPLQVKMTQLLDAVTFKKDGSVKIEDAINPQECLEKTFSVVQKTLKQKFDTVTKAQDDLEKYMDTLLTGNTLNLGKNIDFAFSDYKHAQIKIINPTLVKAEGTSSYKFAIMEPCILADSKVKFAFQMKEGGFQWCAVGICHKKKILNSNYGFPYSTTGHGAYLISTNAGTWSSLEANRNNLVSAFRFALNDTIICTYDPIEKKIFFESKRTNEKYDLNFEILDDDSIHPCVLFHYAGDSVQFINNYQDNLENDEKKDQKEEKKENDNSESVSRGSILSEPLELFD